MLFATWVTALNILAFAALVAAVIYLFVLIVRALKKYIGSKEMREEKQAVKRTLGETLKAHRTRCQMTQEFVAESLGVSRQAVSKWERAESSPDTDNLLALARLYGVSLDALLLHTPAGEAAQAAPEPEEAPADEDAEIFAAARAWDAAEEAEQKARKRARAKWKEGLLWLLTLALMVILPNLTYWLGISEVYAVVVTVAFLITGFLLDNWHPGWMLFLTIPLYYVLIFGR